MVFGAEDVRVVLAEAAHARQAVHHARALVAMQATEVGHAPGQLAVAAAAMPEDQAVARAVHRLGAGVLHLLVHVGQKRCVVLIGLDGFDRLDAVFGRGEEHVLAVVRQVPAGLEQALVEDLRRDHFFVAVLDVQRADVLDQAVVDARAARQEERHGRRVFMKHE